jgi:hypothetical protein
MPAMSVTPQPMLRGAPPIPDRDPPFSSSTGFKMEIFCAAVTPFFPAPFFLSNRAHHLPFPSTMPPVRSPSSEDRCLCHISPKRCRHPPLTVSTAARLPSSRVGPHHTPPHSCVAIGAPPSSPLTAARCQSFGKPPLKPASATSLSPHRMVSRRPQEHARCHPRGSLMISDRTSPPTAIAPAARAHRGGHAHGCIPGMCRLGRLCCWARLCP